MKLMQTGLLAASVLSLFVVVGCSESKKATSNITPEPAITASATRHDMYAGESVMLTAKTINLAGAKEIKWSVSPNVGSIKPELGRTSQQALFTTEQPGVYVITAKATSPEGSTVSSSTTITVSGQQMRQAKE